MRRSLPFLALLLATAAACSQSGEDNQSSRPASEAAGESNSSADMAIPPELTSPRGRASRETGPEIDPASAPGVAFDYSYAFRLQAERIAEMQEEHQRLCSRYGPRCRVTGMDYRSTNEDDVEAMLSFLVDPAIAAQFGRESVSAVDAADGELASSQINGTEVGTALKDDVGTLEELEAELRRVEARLARRLPSRERIRLEEERQSLRAQIAALRSSTREQERQLATTPMVFRYGSGAYAPASEREMTVGEAAENAADSFLGGLNILLIVFVTLSPWLLAALMIWATIRFVRRRLAAAPAPEASA